VLFGVEATQGVGDDLKPLGRLEPAIDDDPVATANPAQAADTLDEAGHGLVTDVDVQLGREALEFRELFLIVQVVPRPLRVRARFARGPTGRPPLDLRFKSSPARFACGLASLAALRAGRL
jgi:hypothetical protein